MNPPVAGRFAHPHTLHGDVRPDDYYWLREKDNPEVIAYLEAENRYAQEILDPLEPFTERLYGEMLARIQEDKVEVAVQDAPYYYYSRTVKGQPYRIFARRRADARENLPDAREEILLDLNELGKGSEYYSVTVQRTSPDQTKLAYLENRDGTDRYTLRVKDLSTGETLPEAIPDVFLYGSVEWDATGEYLFYITVDETQRSCRLLRHRLGDAGQDALIYEEQDITYSLTLHRSRSGRHLTLHSESKITSEIRWLDTANPLGDWQVFRERRRGIEYDVEDFGEDFIIRTNEDAPNFRLLACPISDISPSAWRAFLPYDPDIYLEQVEPFWDCLLISGREEGLRQLWVYRDGALRRLAWPEPIYTVESGENRMYRTSEALVAYESPVTPRTYLSVDLATLEARILLQDEVPQGHDPEDYRQERLWATASDGTKVPMSAVYRVGALDHGPAPLILRGYGSYGMSSDPRFLTSLLPLLDRGVVVVVAHIRGGSEMGRLWYEDGKFLKKRNTFTDFVACAQELVRSGITAPDRMAAWGRSAGGLLMGAVLNLAPDLFEVVSAGVPFVDVMTTMLDASIPLTSLEWDEWGNPDDPEYYHYMRSYSPYDNVEAKDYPHIFVHTGLNDPRVAYWEPAKWVARLRATKTDNNTLVLKIHMGAGHGGSSGRYDRLRESAEEYAFILDCIGIRE